MKYVYLRAVGEEVGATSSLAPKVGPLGQSPKKIGDNFAKATGDWKGLKVTVQLKIQNRQATCSVVPSTAALIIKALKHSGNISMDDIINASRIMRLRSMSREFSGVIKEILGTAQSVGCSVDEQDPHDIIYSINEGEIDCPSEQPVRIKVSKTPGNKREEQNLLSPMEVLAPGSVHAGPSVWHPIGNSGNSRCTRLGAKH